MTLCICPGHLLMSLFFTTTFFGFSSPFFIVGAKDCDVDVDAIVEAMVVVVADEMEVVGISEIGVLICSYITHDRRSCTLSGCGTIMAAQTRFP